MREIEKKRDMDRLTIEYCGEYMAKGLCNMDRMGGADSYEFCYENCKTLAEGNEDCGGCAVKQCFQKLGEYEDLEEQGKLLKLLCAVGDTVYEVQELRERIQAYIITAVYVLEGEIVYEWKLKNEKGIYGNLNGFPESDVGKKVFLTEEEAEAALENRKYQEG